MSALVEVEPSRFIFVEFDAGRIAELVEAVRIDVGLPEGRVVRIEVDERVPLGRTRLSALEPVTIAVEGGAFEDNKRPRQLSDRSVTSVVGRLLLRAADRLDPAFGDPPPDVQLTPGQQAAWDAYAVGRSERLGHPVQKERRRYHFRIRHGFSDTADAGFERLWSAEKLTWADIEAASAEAASSGTALPPAARQGTGRTR